MPHHHKRGTGGRREQQPLLERVDQAAAAGRLLIPPPGRSPFPPRSPLAAPLPRRQTSKPAPTREERHEEDSRTMLGPPSWPLSAAVVCHSWHKAQNSSVSRGKETHVYNRTVAHKRSSFGHSPRQMRKKGHIRGKLRSRRTALCRESRFFRLRTPPKRRSIPISASNRALTWQPPCPAHAAIFRARRDLQRKASALKHIRKHNDGSRVLLRRTSPIFLFFLRCKKRPHRPQKNQ